MSLESILRDNAEVITHREGIRYTVTAALVAIRKKQGAIFPAAYLQRTPMMC